jgi:hypothetical protein
MEMAEEMMTKRKFFILFFGLCLLAILGFSYFSKKSSEPKDEKTSFIDRPSSKTSQQASTTTNVPEIQASSSSETERTKASSTEDVTNEVANEAEFVKAAVTNYLTIKLEAIALDVRQANLEKDFSKDLLASLYIKQTTTQLKTLLEDYQKTKAVNTNSSVRLNDVSVSSIDVFQNASDKSVYYVEAHYTEKPINSETTFSFSERLTVTYKDNQLTTLAVIDSKPEKTKEVN